MIFSIDATSRRSPNFDARRGPITALVIHSDEGTEASSLGWLCNPASQVSSGYYVARTGRIYQLVDDTDQAWHAGVSSYLGQTNFNRISLGIEVEHKQGQGAYPAVQLDALAWLCREKIRQYGISLAWVVAHRWIAQPPGRKIDPTDWSDRDLRPWIAALYSPTDSFAAWGAIGTPTGAAQQYAVPQLWLKTPWLGRCLAAEDYTKSDVWSLTVFTGGVIVYDTAANLAKAYRA